MVYTRLMNEKTPAETVIKEIIIIIIIIIIIMIIIKCLKLGTNKGK